jgi:hypothetical protein
MTLLAAQTTGAMSKGRVAYESVGRDEEEVAEVGSRQYPGFCLEDWIYSWNHKFTP